MKVLNTHERQLPAAPDQVGMLIDSLASPADALWPRESWPRLAFDRALGVGADGGHGPVRYLVEAYTPGRSITFRFTRPKGFDGVHCYQVIEASGSGVILRHTLEMKTRGLAVLSWPMVFRPLHDALIEDSLTAAEASLGLTPSLRPWSAWVRLLRWVLSGGNAGPQIVPCKVFHDLPRPERVSNDD